MKKFLKDAAFTYAAGFIMWVVPLIVAAKAYSERVWSLPLAIGFGAFFLVAPIWVTCVVRYCDRRTRSSS